MRKNTMPGFVLGGLGGLCLWFLALPSLAAQSPAEGLIYYAEGEEISISARGALSPYKAEDLRLFTLRSGDTVQTGPRSFVEIRFLPSGLLVKIAENSSFTFDGTTEEGSYITFSLLYGRMRVISGWNGQAAAVVVRMGSTVADIVEGDIGLDYMVPPEGGGLPVPRVYSFSGSAELIPLARPAPGIRAGRTRSGYVSDLPVIPLGEHESLTMGAKTDRQSLEPEILAYWNQHNFKGHPPLTVPAPTGFPALPVSHPLPTPPPPALSLSNFPDSSSFAVPPALPPPALSLEGENPFVQARAKQTALMIGTIFTAAGTAVEAVGYWLRYRDQADLGDTVMLYGFIPSGLGLISLIVALVIDPPSL
jgi:hypothetical protein